MTFPIHPILLFRVTIFFNYKFNNLSKNKFHFKSQNNSSIKKTCSSSQLKHYTFKSNNIRRILLNRHRREEKKIHSTITFNVNSIHFPDLELFLLCFICLDKFYKILSYNSIKTINNSNIYSIPKIYFKFFIYNSKFNQIETINKFYDSCIMMMKLKVE